MGGKVNIEKTSKLVVKIVGWRNLKPKHELNIKVMKE